MAAETWSADHPLSRRVLKDPRGFEYFQLLHLIERIVNTVQIGQQGPVPDEPVRMRPTLSLGFPACDIDTVEWEDEGEFSRGRLRVTTTFLGLYGSDSPLPTHFTESLLPESEQDEMVRNFLDQFHHRVLALLYRCWAKYRYHITYRPDGLDPISRILRALLGIGTANTAEGLKGDPIRLFRYAGLVSQRPRSAAGLAGLLRDFFGGIEFDIEQCVGRWLPIENDDRNRAGSRKCSLGSDFLLGERIFDRSGKYRVKVGPVGFDDYTRFLPGGAACGQLAELCRYYCEDSLQFDFQVTLKGEEVPELPVGEKGLLGRLSWTTWLKSKDAKDQAVVFSAPDTRGK